MSHIEDRGRIVAVLRGHTDAANARVVDDYPYGYRLRCKRRYWVETALKGAKRGQFRMVTQTTNPRRQTEVWNSPQQGQYTMRMFLVELENGQIGSFSIYDHWIDPEEWMNIVNRGLWDQLNLLERHDLARFVAFNQKRSAEDWTKWATEIDDIGAADAPDFDQWSATHPGRIPHEAAYAARRTYVELRGPDPREPNWWEACWNGLCVAACDGTHHVDATGYPWTQPRPGLTDSAPS
ncbi:hypothetical protein [Nocardia blacklockiae]|uniref:hypothetical protein n=1 Tax=Nocardia blacklockiae TaxID=480036 RepID=UPI001892F14C|nr:hypothetical protein [Nocardia blacklockiae]MBF6171103.1 hypothetical protein [Nocardia blacklockiae]